MTGRTELAARLIAAADALDDEQRVDVPRALAAALVAR